MLVLHAAVIEDRFLVWAEERKEAAAVGAKRRGHKPKAQAVRPLPFDAPSDDLIAAISAAVPGLPVTAKSARPMVLWAPTQGDVPLASGLMAAEGPAASRAAAVLAPWTITTVELDADQALTLLCAAIGRTTLGPGLVVGRDLAFWSAAARLAGALVARQQFLPGLTRETVRLSEPADGRSGLPSRTKVPPGRRDLPVTWRACWEPIVAGDDAKRLADLARQMPAVARAVSEDAAAGPPQTPAASVLGGLVARLVDRLVRPAAGVESRQPPPQRGRAARAKQPTFDSIHDQWLYALRADDGIMEGDAGQLEQFAQQIRQWRRPMALSTTAPVRLCFRLEEPAVEESEEESGMEQPISRRLAIAEGKWYVRYLLQAADDPSLLVPVEEAWKPGKRKLPILKRRDLNVTEFLLSALGQASGLCPPVEASLKTAQPAGYETDATGAHEFLTDRAMTLQQAGFGVLLPAWWTRKGTKLHLSVRANVTSPKMQGGAGGMSLDQVVHFDWEVALGDQTLSREELEMLARLKQPLVRLRGQWVQLSAAEIQAALDYWKQKGTGEASVRQIVQMALGADGRDRSVAFAGVKADGWIGQLMERLDGRVSFEELPAPSDFQGELRPYQARGYSWLAFLRQWGLGACLADDMGLGKTIQTLALLQRDWHSGVQRPVLLICPTSVVGNWQKEAARFTPELPVMVHHGITRAKHEQFRKSAAKQAIVISSYALLHRDLEHLQGVEWAGVVLDEAQNIKNPGTKQAQAARSLRADCRIALTGTPVENHVGDLWSIMEFLNPGLLGTQAEFRRTFFIPIQATRDPEAAQRLKRLTGPFLLRRLKTDRSIIADLPDKLEMKVFCTLTKEQASLYTAVLKEAESALEDSEGIQRKGMILGMLSKLKQVCNHPAHFLGDNSSIPGRSGKLARLTEMFEELLEVGDRALVFSQFTEMGQILRRYLEETFGREVLFLHGGVAKRQRDDMVQRFQSDGGPPIFLLSLKAGGTGLNLTGANHVFHFDRWWNPAVENQATDRAFRIGQTRNVQVHKFLCAGTFEERIDQMIESKKEVAEKVIGAGEGWLTELSNKEIKKVFALGKDAVEV